MAPLAAPPLPTTRDELLDPAWLTAALGVRYPGVEVTGVVPGPVVERVSTNLRFTIETAGPLPPGLPDTLCAKGYFSDEGRGASGVGAVEAMFYRELARPSGVRTLHSHYADVDPDTRMGVVITSDVIAEGGEFLDALSPYTADQVAQSLEQYATLHAFTTLDRSWVEQEWLRSPRRNFMAVRGLPDIVNNYDGPNGKGIPEEIRDAPRLFDGFAALAAEDPDPTWVIIHGDAHIGNVFLDGQGRPSLVDWQMPSHGPRGLDVGYHIASALPVDERERHERDLLSHYLDRLRAGGVEPPSWEEMWEEYRRGIVYGFYLWGITRLVDAPIIAELLHRFGHAALAHDSFGAVGV
jgi:hypothetical protein